MYVVVRTSPDAEESAVPLEPGDSISFGRGGGPPIDLVLDYPGLSRRAGFIGLFTDGRISISSFQTGGAMEVRRANGVTANRLAMGEACVVAPASYTVEVVGMQGPPLTLELRHEVAPITGGQPPAGPAVGAPADATQPIVQSRAVLTPAAGREWQTVLALACVLARRSPRSDGWAAPSTKQLAGVVGVWFSISVSDKWLSDRLDTALDHLNLPRDGTDKLPRLVARALAGGLLPDALLAEVDRRLAELERR
jgi:hypothetical protein